MRVISGLQPSGTLHLGNYLAALKPSVDLVVNAEESIVPIVDLHSLTTIHDKERLQHLRFEALKDCLAVGIDPVKTILFFQSDVAAHSQLLWILSTVCSTGLLDRAVSYKEKVQKGIAASVGLYTYPVLMAADILLYHADTVPVGQDQKQHVEITRDIAVRFNSIFGEIFTLPNELIQKELAIIPGTDGQKMSKSYGNTIPLFAPQKEIEKAIMSIVTDSRGKDDAKDPDDCIVYAIHKNIISPEQASALADEYRNGLPYGEAKKRLLNDYIAYFADCSAKRALLTDDMLNDIAKDGAVRANAIASATLQTVYTAVGL